MTGGHPVSGPSYLDGVLLRRSAEGLHLLLGHSAAVVSHRNVESVDVLDTLEGGLTVVRVRYRAELPPADDPGDGLLPFAMACRERVPAHVFAGPRYDELEARFRARHGLDGPG